MTLIELTSPANYNMTQKEFMIVTGICLFALIALFLMAYAETIKKPKDPPKKTDEYDEIYDKIKMWDDNEKSGY